ncbi:hypothetical protein [Salinisphaera sp. T31B1]|uniref:hypothetical protein n=1 Tax=Salinisphaera sp. T31B1 TaxID=727963 RepID=UPI003342526A
MAYDIRAWLDREGHPQLQIIDRDSGSIRLAWAPSSGRSREIKALFHELMLLSVRENLANGPTRGVN